MQSIFTFNESVTVRCNEKKPVKLSQSLPNNVVSQHNTKHIHLDGAICFFFFTKPLHKNISLHCCCLQTFNKAEPGQLCVFGRDAPDSLVPRLSTISSALCSAFVKLEQSCIISVGQIRNLRCLAQHYEGMKYTDKSFNRTQVLLYFVSSLGFKIVFKQLFWRWWFNIMVNLYYTKRCYLWLTLIHINEVNKILNTFSMTIQINSKHTSPDWTLMEVRFIAVVLCQTAFVLGRSVAPPIRVLTRGCGVGVHNV